MSDVDELLTPKDMRTMTAAEIWCLIKEIERLRASLATIALEESDESPSNIAFDALGNPPNHKLWEMVKATRRTTGRCGMNQRIGTPAWVLRMEQATDAHGYRCSGFEANAVAKEWRSQQAEIERLREALQNLMDEQNGPPLYRRQNQWHAAMDDAKRLLWPQT